MPVTQLESFSQAYNIIIPILTGLIGLLTPVVCRILNERKNRSRRMMIGVIGSMPEVLAEYADFTDYRKALKSGYRVCIVHCRSLSFALRKMDFVVCDLKKDPKIISPDDIERLQAILPKD